MSCSFTQWGLKSRQDGGVVFPFPEVSSTSEGPTDKIPCFPSLLSGSHLVHRKNSHIPGLNNLKFPRFRTAAAAKSLQSCLTLCNRIDDSPPGSPVPGILQARTLEWVAISSSIARKRKVKMKSLSRVRLVATPWTAAYQAPPSMGFFQGKALG